MGPFLAVKCRRITPPGGVGGCRLEAHGNGHALVRAVRCGGGSPAGLAVEHELDLKLVEQLRAPARALGRAPGSDADSPVRHSQRGAGPAARSRHAATPRPLMLGRWQARRSGLRARLDHLPSWRSSASSPVGRGHGGAAAAIDDQARELSHPLERVPRRSSVGATVALPLQRLRLARQCQDLDRHQGVLAKRGSSP